MTCLITVEGFVLLKPGWEIYSKSRNAPVYWRHIKNQVNVYIIQS